MNPGPQSTRGQSHSARMMAAEGLGGPKKAKTLTGYTNPIPEPGRESNNYLQDSGQSTL